LLATYYWRGAADGLWSQAANWKDAQGNPFANPPGSNDTVNFDGNDNDNSRMDLPAPIGAPTISVLKVLGYTGTISLQTKFFIDVLEMTSGTIASDTQTTFGGNPELRVKQDNNSTTYAASSWKGGKIGGDGLATLNFTIVGIPAHPMTFNLGDATTTPTFQGPQWMISADSTVNWDQGNVTMGPVGTGAPEILNVGVFFARSAGKISIAAGRTWMFTNRGDLTMKSDGQFERCRLNTRAGNLYKKAALDGTPGTFVVIGEVVQEGGNVQVDSGTFQVVGPYTMSAGTISVMGSGQVLDVVGDYTQTGGSVTLGGTGGKLAASGAVTLGAGTLTLAVDTGILSAGYGVTIEAGATLYGWGGTITGNVTNAGTLNLIKNGEPRSLGITGNYTQTAAGTLVVGLASSSWYSQLSVSGSASLGGTLTVQLLNGYMPFPGNAFTLITAASLSGTFGTLNLPPLGFGHWQARYNNPPGTFVLAVVY
jgi:hypothetical protein